MTNETALTRGDLPFIGFGTGQLKGDVARAAVTEALHTGYRLIDTGAIYGNETEVGEAIRQSGIVRRNVIVMTKGAHNEEEHGYDQTLAAFDTSLGRLALEYIDYYLIHWPTNPSQRVETWRAMQAIQQSGKAHHIGVSNYAPHHLEELKDAVIKPAVNQIEFHPYVFGEQKAILEYCQRRNIHVVGYSTYANGQADQDPIVNEIGLRYNTTPRQVLTQWSIQHQVVPLVRSRNPQHIAENYPPKDFVLLPEEMTTLDNLKGNRQFRNPLELP